MEEKGKAAAEIFRGLSGKRAMKVFCRDGEVGWVKEVILDMDTAQPISLDIELLAADFAEVNVSMGSVTKIAEDRIWLDNSLEGLEGLSQYQAIRRIQKQEASVFQKEKEYDVA